MTVIQRIRKIRELRNLSQENVADELGMTQQGYSKIETGERELKYSRLENIAKILGVKVEDILAFDEKLIFNSDNNPNSNDRLVVNQSTLAQKEREIYELKLRLQEEELNKLRKQLDNDDIAHNRSANY